MTEPTALYCDFALCGWIKIHPYKIGRAYGSFKSKEDRNSPEGTGYFVAKDFNPLQREKHYILNVLESVDNIKKELH